MGADLLGTMGVLKRSDGRVVRRAQQWFQSIYLALVLVLFFVLRGERPPAAIVIFAQFVSGLFNTPLLMLAIVWLAFRTDRRVRMGRVSTVCLLASVAILLACLAAALAARIGWLGGTT